MARERGFDARRLDVPKFAAAGGELHGSTPLAAFERLAASLMPLPGDGGAAPAAVAWRAHGEERRPSGGIQPWLHLQADATVTLQCQRCLQPLAEPLAVDRWFRFADDEDEAARLDEEQDDDVLAVSHRFDLQPLLEDELILALPIVPRHAVCPDPLPIGDAAAAEQPAAGPFAGLAALKRTPGAG